MNIKPQLNMNTARRYDLLRPLRKMQWDSRDITGIEHFEAFACWFANKMSYAIRENEINEY